jgi:hypothetical protein
MAYAPTNPSDIVRDMQRTATHLGIVTALLDTLVFLRDGDTLPAIEQVTEALSALGINQETIDRYKANHRPMVER